MMWHRKKTTYDKTIKPGELVTMASPGIFVLVKIEPRQGDANPLFISRRILDRNGKSLQTYETDCCDASFCHRITPDFLIEKRKQDIEESTEIAHKRYERINNLLETGYTLKEVKDPPKIHKLKLRSLYFDQPLEEYSSEKQAYCEVRVSSENHSECWSDVTCKNCRRHYEKSVTAKSLVSEMRATARVRNLLKHIGMVTLHDVSQKTEKELLSYKGFGGTSIMETRSILRLAGLDLRPLRIQVPNTGYSIERISERTQKGNG